MFSFQESQFVPLNLSDSEKIGGTPAPEVVKLDGCVGIVDGCVGIVDVCGIFCVSICDVVCMLFSFFFFGRVKTGNPAQSKWMQMPYSVGLDLVRPTKNPRYLNLSGFPT